MQMIVQILHQLFRRQRLVGQMGRAVIFAATAADAGIAVQQLFPGELLDLGHTELLDRLIFHVNRRQRRAGLVLGQHLIERAGQDMEELRIRDIGDESEAKEQMNPPSRNMQHFQRGFRHAGERQRYQPADRIPHEPGIAHQRDPQAFQQKPRDKDPFQQHQRHQVGHLIVQARRRGHVAAPKRDADAQQGSEAENVHRQGKDKIIPAVKQRDVEVFGNRHRQGAEGADGKRREQQQMHQSGYGFAQDPQMQQRVVDKPANSLRP